MSRTEFAQLHNLMQVIDNVDAGIIVVNSELQVSVWNRFVQAYSGISADKALGKDIFTLFPSLPKPWLNAHIQRVLNSGIRTFSSWENRPHIFPFDNFSPLSNGDEMMYQDIAFLPLYDLSGQVTTVCIKIVDVSDVAKSRLSLDRNNAELKRLSQTDGLTQLLNRTTWEERFNLFYQRYRYQGKRQAALLMLDIDHFKRINDSYGHQVGDHVIKHVAATLKSVSGRSILLGRYGGEEFVMLVDGANTEYVQALAKRLRIKVSSTTVVCGSEQIRVSISIGIAFFNSDVHTADEWLRYADDALYIAKEKGRNCIEVHGAGDAVV
ncbi:diguanylate cyclase [Thaumasiovibrio sp. DFM-14]|uniref:sensor domain-containing diguanylate cyclase n=1 Tax=Thaumasiovibrio sp. DFM-14 TaxID=3384792 RepID=UPI0039A0B8B1